MRCHACLHENRESAGFCAQCGQKLVLACRQCDTALRAGSQFCDACGTPVQVPETPREADRRQVTVLFCDLVGSTELSESLDPEEMRDLLGRYHALCARLIDQFGGHLAQYLGDGVLAYFGYPVAHERDAAAAVRAGLAITRQLAIRRTGDDLEVAARVGIHSGLVVAGQTQDANVALPVGAAVNIAARLQGLAQPNTVLISAETHHLTQGFFDCTDLGEQTLKGVSAPMRLFEVRSESGAESPIEAALRTGLTPLVGREVERNRLVEEWTRARNGEGRIVYVRGDAGIGKSRLQQELKQHLSGQPHLALECRCSPNRENSALHPAIDLLRRIWQLDKFDDPSERFTQLENSLTAFAPLIPDLVPLTAALLSMPLPDGRPPLQLTPQRQRQRTLEVLVELFMAMSEQLPALFIVEDLHWIDPSSLDLLGLLLDRVPSHRILVVLLFRPTFEAPWPNRDVVELSLHRLTATESQGIIERVAGGRALPVVVTDELCRRAEGVPLYLEELTKTMLESNQLVEREGRFELSGNVARLEIPLTLQESLMARLDRMAPTKEVVQLGASIGRAFSYELIEAVTDLEAGQLQSELARLVDAEVLHVDGAPPTATYVFKHALIQEAAYEATLRNRRARSHRRIAEVLEQRFPEVAETEPELLGHHFAGAGLLDEALGHYHRAGRRAIEKSADLEAASHLNRALELLAELEPGPDGVRRELELRIDLGAALVAAQGFSSPEVEAVYARAQELCDATGENTEGRYHALSGVFLFHQSRSELDTARVVSEQRLEIAERMGDPALVGLTHENKGTLAFWLGDFEASLVSLELALELYDEKRGRELLRVYGTESSVVCTTYASQAEWFLGRSEAARRRCHASVARARRIGHANSLGLALAFAAALHQLRREPRQAKIFADETVAFSEEQHLPFWRGFGMIFQGAAGAAMGHHDEGIARMLEGVASFQSGGAGLGGPLCLALLADAHLTARKVDEGLGLLGGGLAMLAGYQDRFFDAEVGRIKGELLLAASTPDSPGALACFEGALECARSQGARSLALRTANSLARFWASEGEPDRGLTVLAEVADWYGDEPCGDLDEALSRLASAGAEGP